MKISIVGGGPGGLYLGLLTKKARPDWTIAVFEQNQADDTFGFGVVFSDDTLDEFLSRDPPSYERLRDSFRYWDDVAIHYKGHEIRCGGNGFCGMSRAGLLKLLQTRCQEVGVELHFSHPIDVNTLEADFADSDVIVAVDGINSQIRTRFADVFKPSIVMKSNRFCWMGSTRPMSEFNYFFRETPHGVICAHAYAYEAARSTWVFEMDEACWAGHGFRETDEEGSRAELEAIFADELAGHGLLLNRSHWRRFPRIFCETWSHGKIIMLGDAKASAHFSIGSGTKLAMECAIALSDALVTHGDTSVDTAFAAYESARRAPCQIVQHNADVSLAWFEHMNRSFDMEPMQFAMVVMCRAKSVTYDNLLLRDPDFVAAADTEFYERLFRETGFDHRKDRPTPMFTRFRLRELELENRVVMAPMAQYRADESGDLNDWHFVHYTSHALGGMGLMFVEMTCVSPEARITSGCPGLWTDTQEQQWTWIVDFIHANSSTKICMQLGHAGRKGSTQVGWAQPDHPIPDKAANWPLVSASPLPWFDGESQTPTELDTDGMDRVTREFVSSTERAARAGFDMLEFHCAHGYLMASFLSPLTNRRQDEFGGSIENRLRFPLRVFAAMREAWPEARPMSVRISASDWLEGGISEADILTISQAFGDAGCDLIDVSAGQTDPRQQPVYGRMFQVQFAETIRNVNRLAVMTVGAITEAAQINTLLHTRRADLVALGRVHMWNPYFSRQAEAWYAARNQVWPQPYLSGRSQARRELEKIREKQVDLQKKSRPRRHGKDEAVSHAAE